METFNAFLRKCKSCTCFSNGHDNSLVDLPEPKIMRSRSPSVSVQPTSNTTLVIAHGAFQTQRHYQVFVDAVRKNTNIDRILVPQQSSSGPSPPEDSFAADVKLLHETMAEELRDGRDVLLICHSYGGIPGCEALAKLPNPDDNPQRRTAKVLGIVFVCAFVGEKGQNLLTSKSAGRASWVRVEPPLCYVNNPGPTLYNLSTSPDLTNQLVTNLVPQSWSSFVSTTTHEVWKEYPCFYLRCLHDQAMSLEEQDYFAARMQRLNPTSSKVIDFPGDHVPFASRPEKLAKVTAEIVAEAREKSLGGI